MSPLGVKKVDVWGFFKISLRRVYAVSDSDSSIFEHFGMWPIHFRPAGAAGMGCTHQAHRLKKKAKKWPFWANWDHFVPGGCTYFLGRAFVWNPLR